jgi:hypothetical protein
LPFKYTACGATTWVQKRSRVLNEEVVVLELVFFTRFELRKGIVVGLCRLNQVDPCPITYSLSNP